MQEREGGVTVSFIELSDTRAKGASSLNFRLDEFEF